MNIHFSTLIRLSFAIFILKMLAILRTSQAVVTRPPSFSPTTFRPTAILSLAPTTSVPTETPSLAPTTSVPTETPSIVPSSLTPSTVLSSFRPSTGQPVSLQPTTAPSVLLNSGQPTMHRFPLQQKTDLTEMKAINQIIALMTGGLLIAGCGFFAIKKCKGQAKDQNAIEHHHIKHNQKEM